MAVIINPADLPVLADYPVDNIVHTVAFLGIYLLIDSLLDLGEIIGMDHANMRNLNRIFGGDPDHKLSMLMSWAGEDGQEVDDPWYTGLHLEVARQIERGCRELLAQLKC